MHTPKSVTDRRRFLKVMGLAPLPLLLPPLAMAAGKSGGTPVPAEGNEDTLINFVSDDVMLSPRAYLKKLGEIDAATPIEPDFYGQGGATQALEEAFAKLTGKPAAIYVPTGTLANQLALKLLCGENTKALVPENSHIYRDEADAAQSVHGLRPVPAGTGKPYFTRADLEQTIAYHDAGEVFHSGWGAIAVENPIRRADGTAIPLDTLKDIAALAREKGYKMHLDGARIHIAAACTGVPISEYASLFDTVYISLYKYLNAAGGAILCGPADLIDKMRHHIKIRGGTTFQTWTNSAMALHALNGIEERWKNVANAATRLVAGLNKLEGVHITPVENGTNIYNLVLDPSISLKKLAGILYDEHNMWVGRANEQGTVKLTVNESLLRQPVDVIVTVWRSALAKAKK